MKSSNRRKIISALGTARIAPYLAAAGGNEKKALSLYRWSVELAASTQEMLGLTEVFLRNAIDAQLQIWNNAEKGYQTSWLLHDPASPLRSLTEGKRKSAFKPCYKISPASPS